jgi:hypothetical protein
VQTAMRVWDSLLCEGPKILYRLSLALLKTNEAALLQIQDAGSILRHLRAANASIHDRDALMTVKRHLPRIDFRHKHRYMQNNTC